ncbi:MAG: heparan-alpha-glucosaminide N-acetyltransferase domain-containing protein [Bryobacteraceae bacterium]
MLKSETQNRLAYLDWLRGLAAITMLQGHVFHAFTRTDLREGAPYVLSQFVGGLPPAIFLFLTGVTLAFRMDGGERRNEPLVARFLAALRRAGYLLVVAYLFRIQLWAFGLPYSAWTDILKVDILNCMALTIAVMAPMAVFRTADRARLCAVLGLAIAFLAPVISQLDWTTTAPFVKSHVAPDYLFFSFFPWASFLAFGLSAGSILRMIADDQMDRLMQWAALGGGALIVGGRYFAEIPYSLYNHSEFWLNSPAQVLIKLGVLLWLMTFAFLWTRYVAAPGWSWVRQLGTTSLLVYWVHIELVYGRWLGAWKESLSVAQTTMASVGIIVLMVALAAAKTHWRDWTLRTEPAPSPVLNPES